MCLCLGCRIWIPAAGWHDPLLPRLTRRPARSQRCHPLSRPHAGLSEGGAGLPDTPTCTDGSGQVHREPESPKELHPPFRTVRVSVSGTPGNRVSTKPSTEHAASVSLCFSSTAETVHWWLLFPRKHQRSNELRELSLLAYLSRVQSPDPGPVRPLHSLTPYQVHRTPDPAVVFFILALLGCGWSDLWRKYNLQSAF